MKKSLEFQRLLDAAEVKNRAALARREGVTRARVTQIMNLLHLASEIQKAILALPAGTPERLVTERKLRELVDLEHQEQRERFNTILGDVIKLQSGSGRKTG